MLPVETVSEQGFMALEPALWSMPNGFAGTGSGGD